MSALESQVLEGRAALASAEADKTGMESELVVTRETAGRVEELKAAMAEAAIREEALRVEMTASKSALEVEKKLKSPPSRGVGFLDLRSRLHSTFRQAFLLGPVLCECHLCMVT